MILAHEQLGPRDTDTDPDTITQGEAKRRRTE